MKIPKEIADRLIFRKPTTQEDQILPVERIVPVLHECTDCGASVDRVQRYNFNTAPVPHWRTRCMTCGFYLNPVTQKYESLSTAQLNQLHLQCYIKKQRR